MNRNVKKIVDETKIPISRQLSIEDIKQIDKLAKGTPFYLISYSFAVGFNSGRSYQKKVQKESK